MAENRHSLGQITASLVQLDSKLDNVAQLLGKQIIEVEYFVQMYLQPESIIEEIQRTIRQNSFYMEHLQLELNMLSLGHLSPSVISPIDLRKMLTEIRVHLPPFLKLPNEPGRELWKFYQSLTCTAILNHAQFLVIVSVPLLDAVNKFEVYKIYNLPLPLKDPNVAVKEMPNMVAECKLESKLLAINLEQMKYILLASAELESCTSLL